MRKSILFAAVVSSAAFALPAAAQVVGGVTGNLGGQVGVTRPDAAPLTGQAGQVIRDAAGAASDARVSADVQASTSGHAHAQPDGARAGLDISAGAMVHASDGAMLGTVQSVIRDTAGRVQGFVVRTRDGVTRNVPAVGARVEGEVLVAGWSRAEFDRAPAAD